MILIAVFLIATRLCFVSAGMDSETVRGILTDNVVAREYNGWGEAGTGTARGAKVLPT